MAERASPQGPFGGQRIDEGGPESDPREVRQLRAKYPHERRNAYLVIEGRIFAYNLKVGSSSLHRQGRHERLLQPQVAERIARGESCVLHVRHPLERLVSAWRYFCFDDRWKGRLDTRRQPKRHWGFALFLELTRQEPNVHWCSQYWYHCDREGNFLPTDIRPIDALGLHMNATEHGPWQGYYSDHDRDLFCRLYARDIELWRRANGGSQ